MSGGNIAPDLNKVGEQDLEQIKPEGIGSLPRERHDSKIVDGNQATADVSHDKLSGAATEDTRSENEKAIAHNAYALHALDTSISHSTLAHRSSKPSTPASAGLYIKTNVSTPSHVTGPRLKETPTIFETPVSNEAVLHQAYTSPSSIPGFGTSLRSNLSTSSMASSLSPPSASTSALFFF